MTVPFLTFETFKVHHLTPSFVSSVVTAACPEEEVKIAFFLLAMMNLFSIDS
jgi:hypothetical protein